MVLRHLNTSNRLTARLVCRAFSKLGPDDTIQLRPCKLREKRMLGMLYFCAVQARAGLDGPTLAFMDPCGAVSQMGDPYSLLKPCLYAALGCSNLTKLQLNLKLTSCEAQTLLRLAPTGLKYIALYAPLQIVGKHIWARLPALSAVCLRTTAKDGSDIEMANGLGRVTGLEALSFHFAEANFISAGSAHIDCTVLLMPSLTSLVYNSDPFRDPEHLRFCPSLQELRLASPCSQFPAWVLGQPISTLGCHDWQAALRRWEPAELFRQLRCRTMHVLLASPDQQLMMASLLAIPTLQVLEVSRKLGWGGVEGRTGPCGQDLTLVGSMDHYRQLQQRTQLRIVDGCVVQIQLVGAPGVTSISEKWHPMLCQCSGCIR